MAQAIVMPKLAMVMKQGTVAEWKAQEGVWVEKGQIILVIETEKVTFEIESPASGFLHIVVKPGKTVPVNETLAWLAATQEELTSLQSSSPSPADDALVAEKAAQAPPATQVIGKKKVRISPAAKKLALEKGLDYTKITGGGPDGRIEKADVLRAMEASAAAAGHLELATTEGTGEVIDGKRVKVSIPLTGMRRAIAEHMYQSLTTTAQLTNMSEVDMTEVIHLRKKLLTKEAEFGIRVTYTDILVLALAKAVHRVPMVNSSLIGEEIKIWEDINVGVAVAFQHSEYESGLIVPVVRNADRKSLPEISRAVRDLTKRTRDRQLTPNDLYGGTITLTNFGALANRWAVSTPILNQPQTVIVGTGAICDRVVALNGETVIRPIMTLSITFDHRLLDGLPISRLVTNLNELLENPEMMIAY